MSRGSEWHIWDLHVHTPCSSLNNQFGDPEDDRTWDRYVTQLEQKAADRGVVAIGVTDYFTIDGYRKLRQLQQGGRLAGLLLVPNIEFRVDQVIYRDKEGKRPKRLNIHVLLSPELPPADIEEKFLHDLDFEFEKSPFTATSTRKLKRGNLTEFGTTLRAQHLPFAQASGSDFELGCTHAVVQVGQIDNLLKHGPFRGKYMIVLADEDLSVMDWDGQHHAIRKQLLQMSHALFSANAKTKEFCLGWKHPDFQAYLDEFKSAKPCLWGCDSHGFAERFLEPYGQKYCWIKGEVSWEGLRQVLFEPEDRVRIQETRPEPTKSIYSIDHLSISQTDIAPNLRIERFESPINPNLVAIIGGRGSGKTALLDLIASCFREGKKLSDIATSFYARVFTNSEGANAVPVALEFASRESLAAQVGSADQPVFDKADILYLTQDHFERFAADPAQLNEHVVELIFDRQPDDRPIYDDLLRERDAHQKTIQRINLEVQLLKSEINGLAEIEDARIKSRQGEIEDLTSQLNHAEAKQGTQGFATLALTERLAALRAEVRSIESLLLRLSELKEQAISFRSRYREVARSVNVDIEQLNTVSGIPTMPEDVEDLGRVTVQIGEIHSVLDDRRATNRKDIDVASQQVEELQGIDKMIAELQQKRDQARLEIQQSQNRLADIQTKEGRLEVLARDRQRAYAGALTALFSQRQALQKAIEVFESGKDGLLSNVSFLATIDFSGSKNYIEALAERVDNRSHSEADVEDSLRSVMQSLVALTSDETNVAESAEQIASDLVRISAEFRLKSRVTESEFLNLILDGFGRIGLDIKFNGKPLNKLSMGERAVVLLKIMMALDDRPLLIDQPENHLDNRYIYDELKPAFRKAKTKRQIIIATHNANLVVNTDAEQVIVAENLDGCIRFRAGTLEDPATREHITRILEGGKEAFQKREERYGYRI